MPFVILPTNSASGGYDITNSARFNSGSSDELTRTFPTDGNRKTFTFSCWIKRTIIGTDQSIFFGDTAGTTNATQDSFYFNASNTLTFGGWTSGFFTSTMLFRDVSAWYHIVVGVDSTQATSANRIKFYVNGVEQAYTSGAGYPAQNADFGITKSGNHSFFGNDGQSGRGNGYLAETYLIDGQQLTPSSFGQTDTTTGIWIPKAYTGTYGTNGFYLNFSNASSLGTDASGNGNNFTVNNLTSVDQSKDHPTNNFDTLNPLMAGTASLTYSEGNTKIVFGAPSTWYFTTSTIAVTQGKWYCEVKIDAVGGETSVGIIPMETVADQQNAPSDYMGKESNSIGYVNNGQLYKTNSVQETTSTYTTGNIIGIAFNLDGNSIQFYKNGSAVGSAITLTSGLNYAVGVSGYNNSTQSLNFGQPPYSVSGGYSDGNGYGNFSYQPPSGFLALCTNNLASNG
jgi:hypothetical protein